MTDFNDIMVNFDNRIIFDMGNWSEINYKISFAEQIISEQPADKEGYLVMVGTNQCAFRNQADYEASRKRAKEAGKKQRASTPATKETTTPGETTESAEDAGLDELDEAPELPEEDWEDADYEEEYDEG